MKKYLKIILPVLIVVLTVVAAIKLLHGSVTPHQLVSLIRNFPAIVLVQLLILATSMYIVRAFRFYLLLKDNEINITYWGALKVYISGQALSPLPAGEGARALLIKLETNQSPKKVITPLILLGVTEMIVAVIVTMLGSIFLGVLRLAATIAFVGVLGLGWLLINHKVFALIVHKVPQGSKVKKVGKAMVEKQQEVHGAIFHRQTWWPSKLFIYNLVLALLTDLIGGLIIFLTSHYYHLPLTFLWSFYVFAAATVLGELIPFAPGGIGVTEGGMTGVLLIAGAVLSQALAVVVVFRAVTLVYGFLLGVVAITIFYSRSYFEKVAKSKAK